MAHYSAIQNTQVTARLPHHRCSTAQVKTMSFWKDLNLDQELGTNCRPSLVKAAIISQVKKDNL